LFAQVAARTFGEDGVLGMQFHAQLEVLGGFAILADAQVSGGHALDGAIVVVEHLCRREARKNLDAQILCLLGHPAHHCTQADDVVAVVVEACRQEHVGRAGRAGLAGHQEDVAGDGLVQRCAEFLPVRKKFVEGDRVHDGAGQRVRPRLGALLQHHDRNFGAFRCRQLLQANRGGQAAGTAADHDHVVFHCFARAELGQYFLVCHGMSRLNMGGIVPHNRCMCLSVGRLILCRSQAQSNDRSLRF
jgi:hypothetical protein